MRSKDENFLYRRPSSPDDCLHGSPESGVLPVTLRHLMREAVRCGLEPAALCEGLGFFPSDLESEGFRPSSQQCTQVIRRVLRLLPRPALGLDLGASVNMVSWGLMSLGFMASGSSRELLDFAIVFQRAAGRLLVLSGEERDQNFCLIAKAHFHDEWIASFLVDETFAALVQICRQVVGAHFNPCQVDLVIERPTHGSLYEDVFRCPVRFGRAENQVHFPLKPYAIRTADALVLGQVMHLLTLAEGKATVSEVEASVIQAIRRDLANPSPLSAVAASLNTSERTLRRRLTGRGQNYAALLDEERKSRALSLITHSSRSMREVALECGFADVRTLQRAIKRWTGQSPTGFRKQSRSVPALETEHFAATVPSATVSRNYETSPSVG